MIRVFYFKYFYLNLKYIFLFSGKTFVLNNLTQSNLPSGKKINTKGISFKHVNVDSGTNLILIDTAGSYSPVK